MSNFIKRLKTAIRCLNPKNRTFILTFPSETDIINCVLSKTYKVEVRMLDEAVKSSLYRKVVMDIASKLDYEKNGYIIQKDYADLINNLDAKDDIIKEFYQVLNNN